MVEVRIQRGPRRALSKTLDRIGRILRSEARLNAKQRSGPRDPDIGHDAVVPVTGVQPVMSSLSADQLL